MPIMPIGSVERHFYWKCDYLQFLLSVLKYGMK